MRLLKHLRNKNRDHYSKATRNDEPQSIVVITERSRRLLGIS